MRPLQPGARIATCIATSPSWHSRVKCSCEKHKTLKKIGDLGIEQQVDGLLLYVNDEGAEFFPLDDWWKKKAPLILKSL